MVEALRARPALSSGLRLVGASEVQELLAFDSLIEALRAMFRSGGTVAPTIEHNVPSGSGRADGRLELAPAWLGGKHLGVRLATDYPDNPDLARPRRQGLYLLLDATSGTPRTVIDGAALTLRCTAAAAALGASYLARTDAARLLVVGTGALAAPLIEAHATVRPIRHVLVWGRNAEKATRLAHRLTRRGLQVTATEDLAGAVRGADIVTCATAATEPLIKGEWLPLGAHLDLVGGVTPAMREADDDCVSRARIFVDTREGALTRAGDIVQPLASGRLTKDDIAGDLVELARGSRAGRRFYDQITLFKSVGTPIEDLAAAILLAELLRG